MFWRVVFCAVSFLPLIVLITLVLHCFVEVPFSDQWWLVPQIDSAAAGRLRLSDLWHHANEHRLFFPQLIMVPMAVATGWNQWWEVAVNGLFSCCQFGVVAATVRHSRVMGGPVTAMLVPAASLVVFSAAAFENWMWSWQMPFFMVAACVALTCHFAVGAAEGGRRGAGSMAMAAVAATVATYSFGIGLAAWVGGFVTLAGSFHPIPCGESRESDRFRIRRLAAWAALAGVAAAGYMQGYSPPKWSSPQSSILEQPLRTLKFWLAVMGAPVDPTGTSPGAMTLGALGLGVYVTAAVAAWKGMLGPRRAMAPFVGWGAFAVSGCLLIAVGRANFMELIYAGATRYFTYSHFLWLSIVALLAGLIDVRSAAAPLRRVYRRAGLGIGLLVLVLLATASVRGRHGFAWMSERMARGRSALLDRTFSDDKTLFLIARDPRMVRDTWGPILVRRKLSVFREK